MTNNKRNASQLESAEERPESPSISGPLVQGLPAYSRPQGFVGLFACIPDFRDGLREIGGLTPRDYTHLRMTCSTVAETWKEYPYRPLQPDTKDPYFAGLSTVACDEFGCRNTSAIVTVRRCYGRNHPGIFTGCNKNICIRCVTKAQVDFNQYNIPENEMHYCRPCSNNFRHDRIGPARHQECQCGFSDRTNVPTLPYTEWQCGSCRIGYNKLLTLTARQNLMTMEARGQVIPRDKLTGPYHYGLTRWIDVNANNRNYCPGCRRWYGQLARTYDSPGDDPYVWPRDMVRQCMICLDPRPS